MKIFLVLLLLVTFATPFAHAAEETDADGESQKKPEKSANAELMEKIGADAPAKNFQNDALVNSSTWTQGTKESPPQASAVCLCEEKARKLSGAPLLGQCGPGSNPCLCISPPAYCADLANKTGVGKTGTAQ